MRTHAPRWAALLAAGILTLAGCATPPSDDRMPGMHHDDEREQEPDVAAADVMFVSMMIPHHEQAIEMADTLLGTDGIDDRVRALAERITAAQQPEIDLMQQWLDDWGADMPGMGGGMDHGGGTMSDADVRALDSATGIAAARLFLEQMIEHHRGAVEMAQDEVDDGRDADTVALARAIVASQTAEIAEMQALLAQL